MHAKIDVLALYSIQSRKKLELVVAQRDRIKDSQSSGILYSNHFLSDRDRQTVVSENWIMLV